MKSSRQIQRGARVIESVQDHESYFWGTPPAYDTLIEREVQSKALD